MIIKRMVVLSGFDSQVSERIRRRLSSIQFEVAFVRLEPDLDTYFNKLLKRMHDVSERIFADENARQIGLLASCINNEADIEVENRFFFPILRRLQFSVLHRKDINNTDAVCREILSTMKNDLFLQMSRSFNKPLDERLLLPIVNCRSTKIQSLMYRFYYLQEFLISDAFAKEANRVKKTKVLRIKGVDFAPTINSLDHPVRRCSDSLWCDVVASLRFGFSIPRRFEFDVTCENGLSGKTFYWCCGTEHKIPSGATHLNMRINDDFKCGGVG